MDLPALTIPITSNHPTAILYSCREGRAEVEFVVNDAPNNGYCTATLKVVEVVARGRVVGVIRVVERGR